MNECMFMYWIRGYYLCLFAVITCIYAGNLVELKILFLEALSKWPIGGVREHKDHATLKMRVRQKNQKIFKKQEYKGREKGFQPCPLFKNSEIWGVSLRFRWLKMLQFWQHWHRINSLQMAGFETWLETPETRPCRIPTLHYRLWLMSIYYYNCWFVNTIAITKGVIWNILVDGKISL